MVAYNAKIKPRHASDWSGEERVSSREPEKLLVGDGLPRGT
jgi:hypothetical protein